MKKLENKVAVITGGTSGMALATAKLFVEQGAYVFITGRDKARLDKAVKEVGKNVTGVLGDAADLGDLDRLYETVRKEKGKIDILFASAGRGELAAIGDVTEEHFDKIVGLNVRGTLFTVQKALPLFNDGGSIILNGSSASIKGFPGFGVYSASKAALYEIQHSWRSEHPELSIVRVGIGPTADTEILRGADRDLLSLLFRSWVEHGKLPPQMSVLTDVANMLVSLVISAYSNASVVPEIVQLSPRIRTTGDRSRESSG